MNAAFMVPKLPKPDVKVLEKGLKHMEIVQEVEQDEERNDEVLESDDDVETEEEENKVKTKKEVEESDVSGEKTGDEVDENGGSDEDVEASGDGEEALSDEEDMGKSGG
jgi:hypothetical protein